MRIVVVGGTGLVGTQVVHTLSERGHDVLAASPRTGVDTVTGTGLSEALRDADVVVDVTNSPKVDDAEALSFFGASTAQLLDAEDRMGVGHHVALSMVGTEGLAPQSGYFEAKLLQENMIGAGPVPYTIVRATQFFEFLYALADSATEGDTVRLPKARIQPIASADVARSLAIAATGDPVNGIIEIGGPETFTLNEVIGTALTARGDRRQVIADDSARYWGVDINGHTLIPSHLATPFSTRVSDWVLETAARGSSGRTC